MKKNYATFMSSLFIFTFLLPTVVFSYESQLARKLKTEIAQIETQLADKKSKLNETVVSYIEHNICASAFEKAAAEAERKANVQKTMVAVKVGYDTAMTISSPPKSIKDYLLGKIVDVVNSASWDIKFEYKLNRPDELLPVADVAYQKALLRAREKVSWAKSDKAANQGKELEEGTNEYNYFMFKGFAEGLNDQAQAFRKKQSELRQSYNTLKSEIEKLETALSAKKQLLGEEIKSNNLYVQFKDKIEKEKTAEEARQTELNRQASQQTKDGISDASSVDLSPEINEIQSVSDKLISGKISLEAYQEAINYTKTRAYNKTNPALKPPKDIVDTDKETIWRKEQKKILDAKRNDFDKKVEAIYENVCNASLKCHEEVKKMQEELNAIVYDKNAMKEKTYAYYEKLRDGAPKLIWIRDYSREALASGDYYSLKKYIEQLQKFLSEIPTARQSIIEVKKYLEDADNKYNEYQKSIAKEYNAKVTAINEYIKANFHLLRHYNKRYAGIPDIQYLPENDVLHFVSGGADYTAMLKNLDESEKTIKDIITVANEAQAELEELNARIKSVNERLTKMKNDFDEQVRKVYSGRTTIKELEGRLAQLEKDSQKYCSDLEKMKENYIALQIAVNYKKEKYEKYPAIAKEFSYYKFRSNIEEIDKLIKDTDEKAGANLWNYTAGSVLSRFKKNIEKYKEEEKIIAADLKNYLAKLQEIRNSMNAVYLRSPEQLSTDPVTSQYFTRTRPPRLDNDKLEKELNSTLTRKDRDFNYFVDNDRDFYCGDEVTSLRNKIYEERNAIYQIAYNAGASYEPPRINLLTIDGKDYYEGTSYGLITIYRVSRSNDTIEIKGFVDKPQNLKDIDISLDGGLTYKKGIIQTSPDGSFYGKIDLQPNKTIEIKVKTNSRLGDASSEFPRFGKGIEIFYSTEDATRDLKDTINAIAESYESESIFSFMRNISDNFVGQYSVLENAVRGDFARFDAIRHKFFIDKINISPTMTEGSAEVRWERSWVDTATNKISKYTGNNYLRFEKSGGRWKLLSYAGTPLFGISATSTIDSPTGVVATSGSTSSDDTSTNPPPTTLPVHTGEILHNHYDKGWVFSFVYDREISLWDENGAPHDIEFKYGPPSVVGAPTSQKIYDFGAVSLDSVTTAPSVFSTYEEQAIVGHTYVVVCSNGCYAKFRITAITPTEMTFDWAYQPDGSTNLR